PPVADGSINSAPSDTKRFADDLVAIKEASPPENKLQFRGLRRGKERNLHFLAENGQRSGSGMNSLSPGTLAKRPSFQSSLALSIRSCDDDTKFHQLWRGPSIGAPPSSISLAPSPPANTSTGELAVSTARSPTPSWRSPMVALPSAT